MKRLNKSFFAAAIATSVVLASTMADAETLDPANFTRRMPVTFSGYAGGSALTDFPALVRLSTSIPGFTYDAFSPNGTDLRFADIDGNALDYEIDNWNTNGTSTIWVRIPSLTSSSQIWAYWGASFWAHAPSMTNGAVWASSSHAGVWHFNTIDSGVTPDSTINKLNSTANQPSVSTGRVDGIVGNCVLNSDGASNADGAGFITGNYDSLAVGNTFTISGWVRHRDTSPSYERIFSRKTAFNASNGFETEMNSGSATKMTVRGSGNASSVTVTTPNVRLGEWYHLVFVYNGTSIQSYVNGAAAESGTIGAATDNGNGLAFGNNAAKNESTYKGLLDEFRLRDALSSAAWVKAEYDTVNNANFATFGTVETILTDLPLFAPTAMGAVTFHAAEFSYTLSRLGSSNPDVYVAYGTAPGVFTHTNLVASNVSAIGTYPHTLSGLACSTTYYVMFFASNASGSAEANEQSITTPGEPLMDAATMTTSGSTISISGALTDIGVAATTVELWFGTDPAALSKIDEWPALSAPQSFSKTISNQAYDTYYCYFRAYNVCNGVTNETLTEVVEATVFGDLVWTGAAGDNSWNNPQNWEPMLVPAAMDTAVFTDSGIALNAVIRYDANQHVRKVVIQTATAFALGHADDATAGYSLTITDFDRIDVPGTEGMHEFRATVKLAPDANGKATWTINGESQVRMNAVLDSIAQTTLIKMGTGELTMYHAETIYSGPWEIREGSVSATSSGSSRANTMRGDATVGGAAVPALLVNSSQGIIGDANITVLTNGLFTTPDANSGRVRSVTVKEGGKAIVNGTWFYCYFANLTGGTIDGPASANFWNGGYTQGIRTSSSHRPAYYNIGMTFSSYYDAYVIVEDGPPAIDLDMTLGSLKTPAKEVRKQGAGTVVFGKESTHSNSDGVTALGFVIQGGRAIFNNPTGSGTGKNRTQVNGGAKIGGTGFLGGDSAHTNFNLLVQGGSTTSLASVEPGSVDPVSGASLIGTLTVGSAATTNKVTFGNHSRFNVQIGKDGLSDKLMVHGPLDLSSTSDGISLSLDPDAKAGTYVLAEATEGITGTFNVIPQDFPKPGRLKYTATTVEYSVPPMATVLMVR